MDSSSVGAIGISGSDTTCVSVFQSPSQRSVPVVYPQCGDLPCNCSPDDCSRTCYVMLEDSSGWSAVESGDDPACSCIKECACSNPNSGADCGTQDCVEKCIQSRIDAGQDINAICALRSSEDPCSIYTLDPDPVCPAPGGGTQNPTCPPGFFYDRLGETCRLPIIPPPPPVVCDPCHTLNPLTGQCDPVTYCDADQTGDPCLICDPNQDGLCVPKPGCKVCPPCQRPDALGKCAQASCPTCFLCDAFTDTGFGDLACDLPDPLCGFTPPLPCNKIVKSCDGVDDFQEYQAPCRTGDFQDRDTACCRPCCCSQNQVHV